MSSSISAGLQSMSVISPELLVAAMFTIELLPSVSGESKRTLSSCYSVIQTYVHLLDFHFNSPNHDMTNLTFRRTLHYLQRWHNGNMFRSFTQVSTVRETHASALLRVQCGTLCRALKCLAVTSLSPPQSQDFC